MFFYILDIFISLIIVFFLSLFCVFILKCLTNLVTYIYCLSCFRQLPELLFYMEELRGACFGLSFMGLKYFLSTAAFVLCRLHCVMFEISLVKWNKLFWFEEIFFAKLSTTTITINPYQQQNITWPFLVLLVFVFLTKS